MQEAQKSYFKNNLFLPTYSEQFVTNVKFLEVIIAQEETNSPGMLRMKLSAFLSQIEIVETDEFFPVELLAANRVARNSCVPREFLA